MIRFRWEIICSSRVASTSDSVAVHVQGSGGELDEFWCLVIFCIPWIGSMFQTSGLLHLLCFSGGNWRASWPSLRFFVGFRFADTCHTVFLSWGWIQLSEPPLAVFHQALIQKSQNIWCCVCSECLYLQKMSYLTGSCQKNQGLWKTQEVSLV